MAAVFGFIGCNEFLNVGVGILGRVVVAEIGAVQGVRAGDLVSAYNREGRKIEVETPQLFSDGEDMNKVLSDTGHTRTNF